MKRQIKKLREYMISIKINVNRHMSFQIKLLWLFLMSMMLSGIIFATFYGISKAMFRKSLVSYSEVYVDSISSSITKMVEEIDRLSMTFLLQNDMLYKLGQEIPEDSPEYVEYYQNVQHSLERVLNVRIDIEGILISDSSGKVITGGPNAAYRDGMNISHEKWYQEFMKSDEMFTVLPLHKTNATEVFSVIRKLRSYEDMKVNGIVRIDMKKRLLDEICSKTRMKQDTVMLFDKNRKMFYSFGNYPEKNVIKMLEETIYPGTGSFQIHPQGERLNVSQLYSPYLDMYIAYLVPQDVLMKDLNFLGRIAVFLVLLGGGLGIGLAIGSARVMSRGVSKVMEGMRQAEAGNLDVEIQVEGNDEIGIIAEGLNHMVKQMKILLEEKAQIEIKKKEADMMMLQRQIRPHFLYNTLDGIRMKALLNQDMDTADMIEKLSLLLRRTTDIKTDYVTVQEELEYVRYYIELQNIRFRYKFQLMQDIPEPIKNLTIPKFSLQPLIENAVHHGLEKRRQNRQIRIEAREEDGIVFIVVKDNGQGINRERLEEIRQTLNQPDMRESEHIGLNNINIRLKLLYGKEYGLSIDSEEGKGTILTLRLPGQVKAMEENNV